jgi:signal transduction histidine kinase
VSTRGRVTLCNSKAITLLTGNADSLLGADLEDLVGARWLKGHLAQTAHATNDPRLKFVEGGVAIRQSLEFKFGDAGTYWIESEPLDRRISAHDHSDESVAGIVTFTDITSLKLAQQHREELLRFVSHDMRSPLASILAVIELRKEARPSATDDARFAEISNYAQHTISLAEEFLRIVYASATSEDEFIELDIGGTIDAALELVRPQAQERQIELQWLGANYAPVRGSHNLLVRMFANLLSNAVKFSPRNSIVRLALSTNANGFSVTIDDEGHGISAAFSNTDQFFKPYSAMQRNAGFEKNKGIGLGLAFVKVVVQKHGGSIQLLPIASGTRAQVELPRALNKIWGT